MHYISLPLKPRPAPFDHPDWIYELKYDGFHDGNLGLF
jgi:hypothetical protein